MLKKLWKKFGPNPLELKLKRACSGNHRKFIIPWNRGLGDIPLGLYALVHRIRSVIPDAEITFVTREDLAEGFELLENVEVIVDHKWKRGIPYKLEEAIKKKGDVVLENPDPTHWLKWQVGSLVPKLMWSKKWDVMWKKFGLEASKTYVGVHVQTETKYPYEKNWLVKKWTRLFEKLNEECGMHIILFGFQPTHSFPLQGVIDLRGKTTLFEMLSIIKNGCRYLVVPDSGVLSMTYYLAVDFPIRIVSLWSDPNQGVLKQAVSSPNTQLVHIPLFGDVGDISSIEVEDVLQALINDP